MIIETYSYPRAAVIGNPSDGYFGKTIAFVFSNFTAKVQLYQTPELEIKPQRLDIHHIKICKVWLRISILQDIMVECV